MEKLFSEVLSIGSTGVAVAVLQVILKLAGYDPDNQIVHPYGNYDDATAQAVQRLQEEYPMNAEQRGHFGAQTKVALQLATKLQIVNLTRESFTG